MPADLDDDEDHGDRREDPPELIRAKLRHARALLVTGLVISGLALALAAAHLARPTLAIDNIVLVLVLVAILPWIGDMVKKGSFTGLGEFEMGSSGLAYFAAVQQERKKAQEDRALTLGMTSSFTAIQQERPKGQEDQTSAPTAQIPHDGSDKNEILQEDLRVLEQQYADIRREQRPGHQRTLAMTEVVGKMIPLVSRMESFPIAQRLSTQATSGPERLAAYAYVYANPERVRGHPEWIEDLVKNLMEPDPEEAGKFRLKPFEQYWGLLALENIARMLGPEAIDARLRSELRELQKRLSPGGDRQGVLSRILQSTLGSVAGRSG
jgi:hypothetical protein